MAAAFLAVMPPLQALQDTVSNALKPAIVLAEIARIRKWIAIPLDAADTESASLVSAGNAYNTEMLLREKQLAKSMRHQGSTASIDPAGSVPAFMMAGANPFDSRALAAYPGFAPWVGVPGKSIVAGNDARSTPLVPLFEEQQARRDRHDREDREDERRREERRTADRRRDADDKARRERDARSDGAADNLKSSTRGGDSQAVPPASSDAADKASLRTESLVFRLMQSKEGKRLSALPGNRGCCVSCLALGFPGTTHQTRKCFKLDQACKQLEIVEK